MKDNDDAEHSYKCEEIENIVERENITIQSIWSQKPIEQRRRAMNFVENAMMYRETGVGTKEGQLKLVTR